MSTYVNTVKIKGEVGAQLSGRVLMSTRRPNPPSVYVLSKLFVCALVVVVVVPSNLKIIALVAMSKSESGVERYGEPATLMMWFGPRL